eukprot:COSAG05_NODE_227_length_13407_cov_32.277953_11_plen_87_part_00
MSERLQLATKTCFGQPDTIELFDLETDRWELHNVAALKNYSMVVASLHKQLHVWYGCAGASCPQYHGFMPFINMDATHRNLKVGHH